ncbi:hypothetical protein N7499_004567 [Penicillium canescens]|uniref:Uncharacterized protein n=1 Tax=Penicillium canescens TaxID=5083 RepID=A0AAD6I167_PENCN|nr:uncharacterized protein N7446_004923 [Penicillium canescens]KAJ6010029.1 hypothetical protein N7522_005045 [Penicillium canescens]KAJ6026478.1 hypothetical protein N7460_011295 [Penicillium canescens]KAJ6039761.1 hypothetical protein N7444_008666 [Penicillium canescens]KAJ6067886.1 hypothetical protein N7446_004923 [Penicillium canescens]KAJ6084938.1 hypothetical protein N7499_004567 [Penicillium canescens]
MLVHVLWDFSASIRQRSIHLSFAHQRRHVTPFGQSPLTTYVPRPKDATNLSFASRDTIAHLVDENKFGVNKATIVLKAHTNRSNAKLYQSV